MVAEEEPFVTLTNEIEIHQITHVIISSVILIKMKTVFSLLLQLSSLQSSSVASVFEGEGLVSIPTQIEIKLSLHPILQRNPSMVEVARVIEDLSDHRLLRRKVAHPRKWGYDIARGSLCEVVSGFVIEVVVPGHVAIQFECLQNHPLVMTSL